MTKKEILKKVRILITQHFNDPLDAFNFFDKNSDGYLEKGELKKLIQKAEVNKFLSGIVARKMLDGLDQDENQKFDWREFRKAVNKLLKEEKKKGHADASPAHADLDDQG